MSNCVKMQEMGYKNTYSFYIHALILSLLPFYTITQYDKPCNSLICLIFIGVLYDFLVILDVFDGLMMAV